MPGQVSMETCRLSWMGGGGVIMNAEQPQPHSQALEGEEIVPVTHYLHVRLNINCFCRVLVVSSMFNHTRSYVRNNLGF